MSVDTETVAPAAESAVPDPDVTEIAPPKGDDSPAEDAIQALMAAPAALLLAGNGAISTLATAFQVAGVAGVAGTTAAVGTAAAAGAVVRRAHRAEADRRALAAGKTPVPKPPTARQVRKEAQQAKRTARAAAGARRALGRAATGSAPVGSRSGGLPSSGRHAKAGSHRSARTPVRSALGAGKGGGTPGGRGALGKAAGKTAAGGMSKSGMPTAATGASALPAGGRGSNRKPSRLAAAARRAGGSSAVGGTSAGRKASAAARRGTAATAAAGRRAAGVTAGAARSARKSAAASQARLGKAAHAATGSRTGKVASAAGRRAVSGGRALGNGLKSARTTGRSAAAAARQASGPRGVAKAVKQAVAQAQAARNAATGKQQTGLRKARQRAIAASSGAGAAVLAAGAGASRRAGRWGWWVLRAAIARINGQPIPDPPGRTPPPKPQTGHPPVGDTVDQPAGLAPQQHPPTSSGANHMALGNILEDLSEQMIAAAAGYDPEGMAQWGRDMRALEQVLLNIGGVLQAIQRGADDLPVNPVVKETIGAVGELQQACSSAAADIHATFQAVHRAELDRLENPRPNEAKWDATANQ